LPNKSGTIKSRKKKCVGQVVRIGRKEMSRRSLIGKPKGKRQLYADRMLILKCVLKKWDGVAKNKAIPVTGRGGL
jgi:hypothetical protein